MILEDQKHRSFEFQKTVKYLVFLTLRREKGRCRTTCPNLSPRIHFQARGCGNGQPNLLIALLKGVAITSISNWGIRALDSSSSLGWISHSPGRAGFLHRELAKTFSLPGIMCGWSWILLSAHNSTICWTRRVIDRDFLNHCWLTILMWSCCLRTVKNLTLGGPDSLIKQRELPSVLTDWCASSALEYLFY